MKFRRQGVKREHSVLAGFAAHFERVARIPGVDGVIPGRIARNPTHHTGLVLTAETQTGFKLLAKSTSGVQEVFIVCGQGTRAAVRAALQPLLAAPTRSAPERPRAARPVRRPRASRSIASPPPGSRKAPAGPPQLGAHLRGPLRQRLLALRLRGARWRHRFGNPRRSVRLRP